MEGGYRIRPVEFFRQKLLSTKDPIEIRSFLQGMAKESKDLRKLIHNIMWHMRGSISREEAWQLSSQERHDFLELIEERVKAVEKTGLAIL